MPGDRKIDGKDISPLLLGKSTESPRAAQYYFRGNRLEAVRSGPWKLAIAPQSEGMEKPKTAKKFKPRLYNLDADIGETTDVAAQHPDIVMRLQKFVVEMDADLGANKQGPGVRAPGRVRNPNGLFLPAHR